MNNLSKCVACDNHYNIDQSNSEMPLYCCSTECQESHKRHTETTQYTEY